MYLSNEMPLMWCQRLQSRLAIQQVQEQRAERILALVQVKEQRQGYHTLPREGQVSSRDQGR